MRIACIIGDGTFPTDPVLAAIASRCSAAGLLVHGVVQLDRPAAAGRKCHMDLAVLPDGPRLQISQDRGAHARGCRLDADALERSAALTLQRLDQDTDLLIVNKFGKHESLGRGYRPVIAAAVDLQIPVLTAVNPFNREALEHFCGGDLVFLPPDADAVIRWIDRSLASDRSIPDRRPQTGPALP